MSCLLSYNVTIDGHKFYVIESDGTATRPVLVDSLQIYIGQRYSIVVKADQPVNNYCQCPGFFILLLVSSASQGSVQTHQRTSPTKILLVRARTCLGSRLLLIEIPDDPGLNNAIFRYQGAPDIEPPASKNTSTRPLKESQLVVRPSE